MRLGDVITCSSALARATFENANHLTVGVQTVLVNGGVVVSDGELVLDAPFGRPIRNARIDRWDHEEREYPKDTPDWALQALKHTHDEIRKDQGTDITIARR